IVSAQSHTFSRACALTFWDVLMNPHGEDIEGMTHCLTDYLNFCADVVSPVKTVRCCYPNNKPWVTREVKTVLNKKKAAFWSRDREAMKAAQQEVKHCVKEAKDSYRRKVEQKLRENNMREVWEGVRTITGLNTKTRAVGGTMERANELNDFFNRFNQPLAPPPPPSPQPPHPLPSTHLPPDTTTPPPPPPHQHNLRHSSPLTSATLWKTSRIVPVPKKNRPSELNDFRPVALTSHLMKTLERLFLSLLRPQVQHAQDRLQFAYQPGVVVEDAILYLLHRAHSHLDKGSGTVRILFLDFSSAFNTIQPTLLRDKLSRMGVDPQADGLDLLTTSLADHNFFYNSELCHIQKYADDTAIVGCIREDREEEYRRLVGDFAAWCHTNHLQLNTSKTKELVIDFGRSRPRPRPVLLEGAEVEAVDSLQIPRAVAGQ
ncbi:hypothetical protein L3Q82_024188, partial [Scortum barcoo]